MTSLKGIFSPPKPTLTRNYSRTRLNPPYATAEPTPTRNGSRTRVNLPSATAAPSAKPQRNRNIPTKPTFRSAAPVQKTPSKPLRRGKAGDSAKPPLPHAHAPEGAEFHQSRSRFVQCRNQSTQTEYPDPIQNGNHHPPVSHLRSPEIPQPEESFQETEDGIECGMDRLSLAEAPKQTETPENKQATNRTVVLKRPFKRNMRPVKEPPKKEDPNCPSGHVALEEDERLQMLEKLQQSYEESLLELNRLPLCVDTLRVRTRRIDLERHLQQTEKSIKLFSKPKVYVALSSG